MIFLDDGTYRQQVYDMWQRNFQDPASYADFYFQEVYGKNEVLLNPEPGQCEEAAGDKQGPEPLRGMLHLNPYRIRIRGKLADAAYIVGVATDPQFRRQGVMRELLRESFRKLRECGQCLTYLMPADEQYYLPFDFRFGMAQMEQELLYLPEKKEAAGDCENGNYRFLTELDETKLAEAAAAENQVKNNLFDIYTEITPDYLRRLTKEVGSEYGQIFYVYQEEAYRGRFAVDSENDYLILSQIFCAEKEERKEFLKQAVRYCSEKYHYTRYQIVADPSWKEVMQTTGREEDIRFLPAKQVQKIMFRILDLPKLAGFLACREEAPEDVHADIYIEDKHLKEQDGWYRFLIKDRKVRITKIQSPEEDGGRITIADLTGYLFASKKLDLIKPDVKEEVPVLPDSLTQRGRELLDNIAPLSMNCIMEIV